MAHDNSEESQHFEQVLNRLDALMKRSQSAESDSSAFPESVFGSPLPPMEHSFEETLELSIESSPEPEGEHLESSLSIDSHDVIPVLTEVYEVVLPSPPPASSHPASPMPVVEIETVMASLAPQIQTIVEQSLSQAMEVLHGQLAQQIQAQVVAALQDQLDRISANRHRD